MKEVGIMDVNIWSRLHYFFSLNTAFTPNTGWGRYMIIPLPLLLTAVIHCAHPYSNHPRTDSSMPAMIVIHSERGEQIQDSRLPTLKVLTWKFV